MPRQNKIKTGPPNKFGLDWDAVTRKYQERLQQDIDNGVDNIETQAELARRAGTPLPKPAKKKPPGKKKKPRPYNTVKPEVVERFVELYEDGHPVATIAELTGSARDTIRKWLKDRGVYDPHRDKINRKGRPKDTYKRQRYCGKCGCDLDKPGNSEEKLKPDGRKNGRECIPCRIERSRENRKRAKIRGMN